MFVVYGLWFVVLQGLYCIRIEDYPDWWVCRYCKAIANNKLQTTNSKRFLCLQKYGDQDTKRLAAAIDCVDTGRHARRFVSFKGFAFGEYDPFFSVHSCTLFFFKTGSSLLSQQMANSDYLPVLYPLCFRSLE